jgi:2-dehydropantoate 2-reductase
MKILVFGAGSLGSLVGGLLARRHDVTLVGRDPHVTAVRKRGLRVDGVERFEVSPAATTDATGASADLALVTVKAYDTPAAAEALATGAYGAVCSLQNGMGNEAQLADAVDAPVLAGTATLGARLTDPGRVEWLGRGTVRLGPWRPPDDDATVDRAVEAFRTAGVDTERMGDVRAALWEKLAVNVAINPITALAGVENGALRAGGLADVARAAARETAGVAESNGVALSAADAVDAVDRVVEATAANRSSMRRDVERGRRTEIDAIGGYVLGRSDGEPVPVVWTLTELIRGWEVDAGVRERYD